MSESPEAIDVASTEVPTPGAEVALRAPATPVVLPTPTTPMREWNVIVAQAEMLSQANIVPKAYQRAPANIVAAAIAGRVHGWDAMTAMLNGNVIEGKYGVSPEAQLGLIRSRGHSVQKIAEERGVSVTVRGRRADTGDTLDVTWSIEDAIRAKLANKDNWKTYPAAMLWARAVSELSTQLFSDVTLGLARYTNEELGDDGNEGAPGDMVPARLAPPTGWGSWEECDAAHDELRAALKEVGEDVARKWRGYLKDSGYAAPFTRPQLEELNAELLILAGDDAHRVSAIEPGDGVGGGTPATTGTEAPEGSTDTPAPAAPTPPPAASSEPAAPGPEAGAGDDATAAVQAVDVEPAPPASPPSDSAPAAADAGQSIGTPIRKTTTNALGTLGGAIGMTRATRIKLYGIIAGRPIATGNDLTDEEGKQAQKAMRLIRDGLIQAAFVDADDNPIESEDGDLILVPLDRTDGLAPIEDQDGYRFLRDLAEQHGLEWLT